LTGVEIFRFRPSDTMAPLMKPDFRRPSGQNILQHGSDIVGGAAAHLQHLFNGIRKWKVDPLQMGNVYGFPDRLFHYSMGPINGWQPAVFQPCDGRQSIDSNIYDQFSPDQVFHRFHGTDVKTGI
jgi:hypothetical protein